MEKIMETNKYGTGDHIGTTISLANQRRGAVRNGPRKISKTAPDYRST